MISADGRWLLVRLLSTGVEGWVSTELLTLTIDAETVPVATPADTPTPGR